MTRFVEYLVTAVNSHNFLFINDTLRLRQYLELGLSPNHVTPELMRLRDEVGPFSEELFQGVMDRFVRERTPH